MFHFEPSPDFFRNLGLYQMWFISGEALHPDLALLFRRRAAPGAQLVNLYGSTEVRYFPSPTNNFLRYRTTTVTLRSCRVASVLPCWCFVWQTGESK